MDEQSQQANVADLARLGYKQEFRLAQTSEDQSLEEYTQIKHVMASHD